MLLHLHQRHAGVEDDEQRRRQDELIEQQFPQDNLLGGAREGAVEPLVPVVEDRRVDERAHDGVAAERGLVDLRWRGSLRAIKLIVADISALVEQLKLPETSSLWSAATPRHPENDIRKKAISTAGN